MIKIINPAAVGPISLDKLNITECRAMALFKSEFLFYRTTESAFLLGLVELLSNAPIFIVGLVAGAWLEN